MGISRSFRVVVDAETVSASELSKSIVQLRLWGKGVHYSFEQLQNGSGVLVNLPTTDGEHMFVLTNAHVVTLPESWQQARFDTETFLDVCFPSALHSEMLCGYSGVVVQQDDDLDLALIAVNSNAGAQRGSGYLESIAGIVLDIAPVQIFSNYATTALGDSIRFLGYPSTGASTVTLTQGVVSGSISRGGVMLTKTDAQLNPGSSGGGAFTDDGSFAGVAVAISIGSGGALGLSIPADTVVSWLQSFGTLPPPRTDISLPSNLEDTIITPRVLGRGIPITLSASMQTERGEDGVDVRFFDQPGWELSILAERSLRFDYVKGGDILGKVVLGINPLPYALFIDEYKEFLRTLFEDQFGSNLRNFSMTTEETSIPCACDSTPSSPSTLSVVHVTFSVGGEFVTAYGIPVLNYHILSMGVNRNQDDDILQSSIEEFIQVRGVNPPYGAMPILQTSYTVPRPPAFLDYPEITLNVPNEWIISTMNNTSNPFDVSRVGSLTQSLVMTVFKNESAQGIPESKRVQNTVNTLKSTLSAIDPSAIVRLSGVRKIGAYEAYEIEREIIDPNTQETTASVEYLFYRNGYSVEFVLTGDSLVDVQAVAPAYRNALAQLTLTGSYDPVDPTLTRLDVSSSGSQSSTISPAQSTLQCSAGGVNTTFSNKYKGRILLQVEGKGEAWYVHPDTKERHYMGRPADALALMRRLGMGTSNHTLEQIPVADMNLGNGSDTDGDELSDVAEEAFGTDPNNRDTDGDGFDDKAEVLGGYHPLGKGKWVTDQNRGKPGILPGKIFLQVESHGEAWYINPLDGKRYYLGRPNDAFAIMKKLALGMKNSDLCKVGEGE